jgi:hypothetical protein
MPLGDAATQRSERGSATAETAVVLPALVVLLASALWLVSAAGTQLRCLDAAREAARALARGEPSATVMRVVELAAPGASLRVRRAGGSITVTVGAAVRGPGVWFARLPELRVAATTSALAEPAAARAGVAP